ncbi:MAG: hypothetical protein HQ564_01160 [Candidatus Saganbacteria bacterium]|nr:hypothetical protein [Candidatus Saganbacteria bacterium]
MISMVCKKLSRIIDESGSLAEIEGRTDRFFGYDRLRNLSCGIMGMEGLVYNCLSDDEKRVIQSIALGKNINLEYEKKRIDRLALLGLIVLRPKLRINGKMIEFFVQQTANRE